MQNSGQPVDFYSQFEQNVNGMNGSSNIASAPQNSQNPNLKKKIIILAASILTAAVVIAVVVLILNKNNNGLGSINKEKAKEYATYVIFGNTNSSRDDFDLTKISRYYLNDDGRKDSEYMKNIKEKLTELSNSATGDYKKELLEQLQWFDFYEAANAYLMDYTSDFQYSAAEDDETLAEMYKSIPEYVEAVKNEVVAKDAFIGGSVTDQEYEKYFSIRAKAVTALSKNHRSAYEKIAEYAEYLYGQE